MISLYEIWFICYSYGNMLWQSLKCTKWSTCYVAVDNFCEHCSLHVSPFATRNCITNIVRHDTCQCICSMDWLFTSSIILKILYWHVKVEDAWYSASLWGNVIPEVLSYGTCCQGSALFHLPAIHLFTNVMNLTCLCRPTQSWSLFTNSKGMKACVGISAVSK